MMKAKTLLTSAVMAVLSFAPVAADELVIMHTNDVHGYIDPEKPADMGGFLRRKVLVDSIRGAEKHTLLVDAGDDVQGYMYFTLYGGKVEYTLMDRLGYDIVVPGNHEFDNGMEALKANYSLLNADRICANYDFTGTVLEGVFQPYTIKTFDGKRIAFIGVGCQPKGMISDANIEGVEYSDAMAVADSVAGALKSGKKADYAVVVSHIGYYGSKGLPSDSLLAATSRNVDVIIGGHSHTLVNPKNPNPPCHIKNAVGKTVLVAQTGKLGQYLGKVTIDLDNLSATPDYELLPVDSRYDNRIDASLNEWLKPYRAGVDERMNKAIGTCEADMSGDALMNWVADLVYDLGSEMTDYKVDMAVINKGGIRRPMMRGGVSQGLIETMLPFNNRVVLLEIDGKSLQEGFDVMASRGGDGISMQASAGMKDGKAVDVMIDGKPLDPNKTYLIATIDYLAGGGDYMQSFTRAKLVDASTHVLKEDAVAYVKAMAAKGNTIKPDMTKRMYNK